MNDVLPATLSWLAAAVALGLYLDSRRRRQRTTRKPSPNKTTHPQAAVIEIVEKDRATTNTASGSVIIPNDIRINGQSLLVPSDHPVKVHEMELDDSSVACVTLTLFARRVTIAAEGDLT